ncbi:hypothetical protein UCREL1_10385 [Eutypa lata UCREL1]|uniref:Uncharacterized protein n=1 Tax=Eutypa lata (strain UCR-EL1) TaxID=1287681 RepID=M7SEV6_EUTLA|nr:hypothetical protein UCREL1_10385 [Eutypa lata UCREL1]
MCRTSHEPKKDSHAKLAQDKYHKIIDKALLKVKSDVEKWSKIFGILYPEVTLADYPSPYREERTVERFKDYTSQNLARLLDAELEGEVEESKLMKAVERALVKVHDGFRSSLKHLSLPANANNPQGTMGPITCAIALGGQVADSMMALDSATGAHVADHEDWDPLGAASP